MEYALSTKAWYRANKAHHLAHIKALRLDRAPYMKYDCLVYKGGSVCVDCGYKANIDALEFDHVRGTKVTTVGVLAASGYMTPRLRAELDKCDVVCANCHCVRTAARRRATCPMP
jgi:hypothetical protein